MGHLFRHGGHLFRVAGLLAAGVVTFLVLALYGLVLIFLPRLTKPREPPAAPGAVR
jgi:hypothetical protein